MLLNKHSYMNYQTKYINIGRKQKMKKKNKDKYMNK